MPVSAADKLFRTTSLNYTFISNLWLLMCSVLCLWLSSACILSNGGQKVHILHFWRLLQWRHSSSQCLIWPCVVYHRQHHQEDISFTKFCGMPDLILALTLTTCVHYIQPVMQHTMQHGLQLVVMRVYLPTVTLLCQHIMSMWRRAEKEEVTSESS